jgi:hypothetical protein
VSFDYQGNHHVIDWDELIGDEDEDEGMPHEEFMAELKQRIEEQQRGMTSGGALSIRAVKHAASENPFLGVREATDQPHAMLSTRDIAERVAIA